MCLLQKYKLRSFELSTLHSEVCLLAAVILSINVSDMLHSSELLARYELVVFWARVLHRHLELSF